MMLENQNIKEIQIKEVVLKEDFKGEFVIIYIFKLNQMIYLSLVLIYEVILR